MPRSTRAHIDLYFYRAAGRGAFFALFTERHEHARRQPPADRRRAAATAAARFTTLYRPPDRDYFR